MVIKLGIIGCGNLAEDCYRPALRRLETEDPKLILAGCCDRDITKSKAYARKGGFQASYDDAEQMLRDIKPDCLLITTPVSVTAPLATKLCWYKIPMMIEKPPALNTSDAKMLLNTLNQYQVLHQIAFNRHHMPLIRTLKKRLEYGSRIQNIQVLMSRYKRLESTFYTTAIHGVDLLRYVATSPFQFVNFSYQDLPEHGEGVCNMYMDCTFENGISAQASFLVSSGLTSERIMITCEGESYFVHLPVWGCSDSPGVLMHYESDTLSENLSGDKIGDGMELFESNGFYMQLKCFLEAVRNKRQPDESMAYAYQAVEIAECMHKRIKNYSTQK